MYRFIPLVFVILMSYSCKEKQTETITKVEHTENAGYQFYVGTYTETEGHVDGKADGIYMVTFDAEMKNMVINDTILGIKNPTFLARKNGNLLAVSEIGGRDGDKNAYLVSYNEGKEISRLSTNGYGACHVSVSPDEKWTVVTNYSGGVTSYFDDEEIASFAFEGNGTHERQEASHPHSSLWSPDGKYLYVADLGNDKINVFEVDGATKSFNHNKSKSLLVKSESGPRHMAVSSDGKTFYILNELDATVVICERNIEDGTLSSKSTNDMLPKGTEAGKSGADIHIHPNGKFFYVSNRGGHNSISAFKIGGGNTANLIGNYNTKGASPRNFAITKDGNYLLAENQDTGDISTFKILDDGTLRFIALHKIPTPVCLVELS